MNFSIIVAMDEKRGIGKNGDLPWRLPEDLKHFKNITIATDHSECNNVVIMGRKTWDSLPLSFRPLPDRLNIVLSRNPDYDLNDAIVCDHLDKALSLCENKTQEGIVDQVFVIGGGVLFEQAVQDSRCEKLFVTEINADFACDTFFPMIPLDFVEESCSDRQVSGDLTYCFKCLVKKK